MPILFFLLLGFLIFILGAGWGFNALSHRVGSDVAIAIYFLALAILSAGPIAWWRSRQRRTGRTIDQAATRRFSGAQSSILVSAHDRSVTLTLQGTTRRYPLSELREWSVFERTREPSMVGVELQTRDLTHSSWSLPLWDAGQAHDCVRMLDELKGPTQ
ncbi:hypothetical protein [Pararobbsia alpina]|uniref:Uncharacterized protein n=1 Tax=Pararobbsia alpina TaxID=621374 RepID=A0A6S7BP68_9BURK|nr:hypothetical protein [Pararobbsia alpina]CAB3791479.1 hypothetical protein LMG28138_03164 [Pararobbsia alpina]